MIIILFRPREGVVGKGRLEDLDAVFALGSARKFELFALEELLDTLAVLLQLLDRPFALFVAIEDAARFL